MEASLWAAYLGGVAGKVPNPSIRGKFREIPIPSFYEESGMDISLRNSTKIVLFKDGFFFGSRNLEPKQWIVHNLRQKWMGCGRTKLFERKKWLWKGVPSIKLCRCAGWNLLSAWRAYLKKSWHGSNDYSFYVRPCQDAGIRGMTSTWKSSHSKETYTNLN